MLLAGSKRAGEALEEALRAALGLDVRDRSGNGNLGFAFDDVEGGGAEIAFAADELAGMEGAFDDGATV